jgi:pyruvate formate-lyase/glycerol dehydratase family glycyl radical enzyme
LAKRTSTHYLVNFLLRLMAVNFRYRKKLRELLHTSDGWMDFAVGVRTDSDSVAQTIRFANGKATVASGVAEDADCVMVFKSDDLIKQMLKLSPAEVMNLLLKNQMRITGNLATMSKFNYLLSALLHKPPAKIAVNQESAESEPPAKRTTRLSAEQCDEVEFLDDPYLSQYALSDFPRLERFLDIHLNHKPALCHERAQLVTDWHRANGFEIAGGHWVALSREDESANETAPSDTTEGRGVDSEKSRRDQGEVHKHIMENRQPIIRENDLLAGTTTAQEIGVVLYPDTHASMIWGELLSAPDRPLNPYDVSEETREVLHRDVFPFWEKINIRELVRTEHAEPLCQQLDERFAVYFVWKTVAVSHTIADFPKLLALGTSGIIKEIEAELSSNTNGDGNKRHLLNGMIRCLQGIESYAANLAERAQKDAEAEQDPQRKSELETIAEICKRVPKKPAKTLHEALQTIWIGWIALHMENTNAGLSLGRMDQWLQPFFATDLKAIKGKKKRGAYIKSAVELVGCFMMRCTDHLPLVPDLGNFLFGGSSSDQALTLGGVTPDGKNAVNDMTYVFLKATEMLSIRDPNVNARFAPGINSETYLKRLCEVNLITAATPSMHNDDAMDKALTGFDIPIEHRRDWSATGCVEPTISGKHMGHTGCIMMNMVAALEMAMHDGRHPLMAWDVGPKTGDPKTAFESFEDFFLAFEKQYRFLIEQACEFNNILGEMHKRIRPTPFLSSLVEGTITSGKDVIEGGALYNTTGAACIGLADITDSMMAVKKLVFEEKKATFAELADAVDQDFENDAALHAMITKRVPKFGSGDPEALEMAQRIAEFSHRAWAEQPHYRGGTYSAGFWSMSNHVAFGVLSGALPSGRRSGKPFTPGLTPQPSASEHLLGPLRDVAALKPEHMTNNVAFNVKIVPGATDSHGTIVDRIASYVKTFFDLGGMQMQFNIVTSATLRDAMKHPENYRNLLVRISGYNAYFVTLNRDMQRELIERAEYGIG